MRILASFTILTFLLVSTFASFSGLSPACAQQRTWTVEAHGEADFDTIQEAIDHASVGDTIFVRRGTYYENVIVDRTVSLVGEDVSTTIIDGNGTGHVVNIVTNYVNVTGFTVQNSGNIQMPDLDAGICLNGTEGCIISKNRAINNDFCGISLLYSNGNTITDNNLSSAGWGGIHLMSSSHNMISGNTITDKYGGINGHVSSNYNNITENTISNCTYGTFYHAASYNNICRNNISAIEAVGIWLQDEVSYNNVAENSLINNTVAIRLQGPNRNNTLSRNFITGAEHGIKLENTVYTSITDNTIVNNRAGNDSWSAGIRLDYGRDSQIHSNIITGNYYGILLYTSSPRVSVYGNNISDNEFGVRVASGGSNNLNMTGNLVANNIGYGIGLTGFGSSSNYATISQNTITNNSDGIALGQYSSYNKILQNNISRNKCGFYIEFSTQNTIYGNNIVDNELQVNITSASTNAWDNGYPYGGNYWSDHSGTDLFCGAYQNRTGSDGIADEPYTFDADNKDRYPLVNLWTPQVFITDINDDGTVNILDITIVAKAFGTKQGEPMYNEAADFDKNGQINIVDITIVAKDYGKTV
jgi:parallel beta-helix repeat protein